MKIKKGQSRKNWRSWEWLKQRSLSNAKTPYDPKEVYSEPYVLRDDSLFSKLMQELFAE